MSRMVRNIWLENVFKNLEVVIQTRLEGLSSISKHREMLKIQGEAELRGCSQTHLIIHEASTKKTNTGEVVWKSEEEVT